MLSGEKKKNIHESQSQRALPGSIPGLLVTQSLGVSSPRSSQDNGSSVRWELGCFQPQYLVLRHLPLIGGGSFPLPFASTFKYSESQLMGELGSKDSTKGKKCVQMAHGGDQHISHKFSPAQDAPAWRQRPRCGPEPGM